MTSDEILVLSTSPKFQLPILATAAQSYRTAWAKRSAFAVPLLLVFISKVGIGLYASTLDKRSQQVRALMAIPDLLLIFAIAIFAMSVAVGIHRTIVLGEERRGLQLCGPRWAVLRYVGVAVGLTFLLALFTITLSYFFAHFATINGWWSAPPPVAGHQQHFPAEAVWAAILVYSLFFLRWMLALPAAALGEEGSLSMSFKATRGNWLRLMGVAILTALPWIALSVLSAAFGEHQINEAMRTGASPSFYFTPAYLILSGAIYAIELAVLSSMLSISYMALVKGGEFRLRSAN